MQRELQRKKKKRRIKSQNIVNNKPTKTLYAFEDVAEKRPCKTILCSKIPQQNLSRLKTALKRQSLRSTANVFRVKNVLKQIKFCIFNE